MNGKSDVHSDAYGWIDQDGNGLRLFRRWPDDLSSQIEAAFAGKNWDVTRAELSCAGKSDIDISVQEAERLTEALFKKTELTRVGSVGSDRVFAVYDFLEEGSEPELTPLPFSITTASNPMRAACKIGHSIPMM